MIPTPEPEKVDAHREAITTILDFLEALPGLDHELHYTGDTNGHCYAAIPAAKLIYRWLEIDPAKLEAEKRQMAAELRSSNAIP